MEATYAKQVINQAFTHFCTPEIVNDDQGSEFTAEEFAVVVLATFCKLSMDGRGAWLDNVFVECLLRSVKFVRVCLKACDSMSAARVEIVENPDWYNLHRAFSSPQRLTPNEKFFVALPLMSMVTQDEIPRAPRVVPAALQPSQAPYADADNAALLANRPLSTSRSGRTVEAKEDHFS